VVNSRQRRKKDRAALNRRNKDGPSQPATMASPITTQQPDRVPALAERNLDRYAWFRWLRNHPKVSGGGGIGLAFAIVIKGIDWQIDGAVKSAAVAFLIGWAVFSFVLYISSHWDKRRPLMMATQIMVGLGLIAVWKAYLPAPTQSVVNAPVAVPTPSEPTDNKESDLYPFREKSQETVTFIFGHNFIPIPKAALSSEPQFIPLQSLIGPDSYNSVSVYLRNGKPLVDVKMWGDGDPEGRGATYLVEVRQNEFTVRPPAWDRNFNNQAFEVVDESGTPMLQIYYKQADHIVINGVFRSQGYMTYATEETGIRARLYALPIPPPLKTMFRYPSIKHKGEFAPNWKPLADAITETQKSDLDITKPVR
jgi:hypothetical protein